MRKLLDAVIAAGPGPAVPVSNATRNLVTVFAGPGPPTGFFWYASPAGLPGNTGAIGSPWDLQTALNGGPGGAIVAPGDTIFMRAGTYSGLYFSRLNGTLANPINVRNFPTEKPKIDGYLHTTLTGSMTALQTTVPMAQLQFGDGQVINIGTESIRLHGYSAGAYQAVDRGWDGTTATTHNNADAVDTDNGHCLTIQGTYTWWIGTTPGFEVTVGTARYANRVIPTPGSNPFGRPPSGVELNGSTNKFVNGYTHDTTDGYSTSAGAADNVEFHGCIGQYVGWDASDRGHGHAFYIHNDNPGSSQNQIGANIALESFDFNAQIYTGGTTLGNVYADGFFSSQAGVISSFGPVTEVLFGFAPGPITLSTLKNAAIYASGLLGFGLSWGYNGGGTDQCVLQGNYVAAQNTACAFSGSSTNLTTSGNTWVGPSSAPNPASGTFLAWKPGSGKVFVIAKNLYEVGRANIAVFNWDHSATVSLDFSSFLNNGDTYVVRNAFNYLGTPLASGTWNGTLVVVNTSGLVQATPVGKSAPTEPGTEFNIYVVSKT
jgi:hypothetical protein